MSLEDILNKIASYTPKFVTVTGGEPLAQKPCVELLKQLCDAGYEVSLETSGALPTQEIDPRVVKVIDIKTPASGEESKNLWGNIDYLSAHDQLKFVICNRDDYEWSKRVMTEYKLSEQCEVLFSPSYQDQPAGELADWIIADRLPVRLQIQLHKFLWGDVPGR